MLPTDAELDILAVLWRLGPSTVRTVHQALGKKSGYTTTLKQMQVMAEKGLLVRDERARSHIYQARAPKEQTRQQVAGDLLRRCFDGSAKDLLMGALSAQPASDAELAEIGGILKDLKRKRSSS